jgi:hypothetical protein
VIIGVASYHGEAVTILVKSPTVVSSDVTALLVEAVTKCVELLITTRLGLPETTSVWPELETTTSFGGGGMYRKE